MSECRHKLERVLNSNDNGYGGVIAWCPECGALSYDGLTHKDRVWEKPKTHRPDCAYRTNSGYGCRCPAPPLDEDESPEHAGMPKPSDFV